MSLGGLLREIRSFVKSWTGAKFSMKKLTAEWVRKAESDYRAAEILARNRPPENDLICFCCQQAAEKYLKALLTALRLPVPRVHNLEDLLGLLRPHHPGLFSLRRGLVCGRQPDQFWACLCSDRGERSRLSDQNPDSL